MSQEQEFLSRLASAHSQALEGLQSIAVQLEAGASGDDESINASKLTQEFNVWKERYVGKKAPVASLKKELGLLDPASRRHAGAELNRVRDELLDRAQELGERLVSARLGTLQSSSRIDMTELALDSFRGHIHLITQTRDELEDVFIGMGYSIQEGPEVETDWYNFEALNIPPDHPARGMFDTFYLKESVRGTQDGDRPSSSSSNKLLLRTHTSPVQIHTMSEYKPPIYMVAPGKVYRRDTPDARHIPIFNQIEGLVVDKNITFADLAGTIESFTTKYFGQDIHSRLRPAFFPFTEPSAEFEITCAICSGSGCRTCSGTGWIELGGCGMVDPNVFEHVGIDPEVWSGFAFGFGIDRCAQMRHSLVDMRVLLANDVRFLEQF